MEYGLSRETFISEPENEFEARLFREKTRTTVIEFNEVASYPLALLFFGIVSKFIPPSRVLARNLFLSETERERERVEIREIRRRRSDTNKLYFLKSCTVEGGGRESESP